MDFSCIWTFKMIGDSKTRLFFLWLMLVGLAAGRHGHHSHGRTAHMRSLNNSEEQDEIGDVVAPRNLSPWQVSIQDGAKIHKCSGAILGKDWVVTTAHCLSMADFKTYRIVVGSQTLGAVSRYLNSYSIEYAIVHPHFDKPKKSNDIALIYTERSIQFNIQVKAIDYNGSPLPRDSLVMHTGWSWRKGQDENKMRAVYHRVIPYKICLTYFDKKVRNPIEPGHLCLHVPKDSDYCLKETGGLLVHNKRLVGLSSFGTPCATGEPFMGTRISFYFDFIRTTTKGCIRCTKNTHFEERFFSL